MTLNRYSHVTPDMQRSAADTLDAAFSRVSYAVEFATNVTDSVIESCEGARKA
jgi:hypothetical protein